LVRPNIVMKWVKKAYILGKKLSKVADNTIFSGLCGVLCPFYKIFKTEEGGGNS